MGGVPGVLSGLGRVLWGGTRGCWVDGLSDRWVQRQVYRHSEEGVQSCSGDLGYVFGTPGFTVQWESL